MIHPLIRGANNSSFSEISRPYDSSPHARGRLRLFIVVSSCIWFIPSYEGQTTYSDWFDTRRVLHPLLREANVYYVYAWLLGADSSHLARGKRTKYNHHTFLWWFIPSREGQTVHTRPRPHPGMIHPLLQGASITSRHVHAVLHDSSPLARGKHSVFMRLSAALNTSLCNLHKFNFQLITYRFPCI